MGRFFIILTPFLTTLYLTTLSLTPSPVAAIQLRTPDSIRSLADEFTSIFKFSDSVAPVTFQCESQSELSKLETCLAAVRADFMSQLHSITSHQLCSAGRGVVGQVVDCVKGSCSMFMCNDPQNEKLLRDEVAPFQKEIEDILTMMKIEPCDFGGDLCLLGSPASFVRFEILRNGMLGLVMVILSVFLGMN